MQKQTMKRLLVFLLTTALASGFCISLYFFNNKYTRHTVQPANGLLAVSGEDLEDCLYLINGWAFYPDVLLTPEDFQDGLPSDYMVYTSIGEHTRFDYPLENTDPHGSGTYSLHLVLPEQEDVYALEMPEIFSSCRLYVNGELLMQAGNPDPESYLPRTRNKIVTFEAAGQAQILIQVSDYSHFYSGIVYPPAFGRPALLDRIREIRFGLTIFWDTAGLLLMAFAFYTGLRMRQKNAVLYGLLCLVMCLFTSYGLIHTQWELPIFPWYTLELVSGYVMTFLILLLHNIICDVERPLSRISCGAAFFVCILALLYGLGAAGSLLTVPMMKAFSLIVSLFKGAAAVYLLITAWFACQDQDLAASPLLCASIFYGTLFIWDRIFPGYEPIYGGWFMELGSCALVLAVGHAMWRDIITAYSHNLAFAEEHRLVTRQLSMQSAYMKQIAQQNEENRRLTHDFRQHLHIIASLTRQAQEKSGDAEQRNALLDQLASYLSQIQENPSASPPRQSFCQNTVVDSLLQYYGSAAAEAKIQTDFQLSLPDALPLSDVELCAMLGNLLENALDACQKLKDSHKKRQIRLSTRTAGHILFLSVENTYDGLVFWDQGRFLSRKRAAKAPGIGLRSVQDIVERHGGSLNVYPLEQTFRVSIVLPLQDPRI